MRAAPPATTPRARRNPLRAGGADAYASLITHDTVLFAAMTLALFAFFGPIVVRDAVAGDSGVSNAQLRLLAVPAAAVGLGLIVLRPLRAFSIALGALPLVMLVGLAAASTVWSVQPSSTVTRSVAIVMVMIAAIGFATRFSALALAQSAAIVLAAVGSLSLALWLLGDPLAFDYTANGVRGVFSHKNSMGQAAALGFVVGLGLLFVRRGRRLGLVAMLVSAIGLAVANSAAALVSAFVGAGLLITLTILTSRLPGLLRGGYIAVCVLCAGLAPFLVGPVLNALGRDATLTGRDKIWAFVLDHIAERPLLGHGFRAFWETSETKALVAELFPLAYTQSHNSYLEILLELGWAGMSLLLVWIANVFWLIARTMHDPSLRIWGAVFVMIQVYGFAEAMFLAPTGFAWLLTVTAAVTLASSAARQPAPAPKRRRAPPQPRGAAPANDVDGAPI